MAKVPHHIIQRGNKRSACFYAEDDYCQYFDWLLKYSIENECFVHAYVLMTNYVHLLITLTLPDGLAKLMKSLGQRYVQYVKRTYIVVEPCERGVLNHLLPRSIARE